MQWVNGFCVFGQIADFGRSRDFDDQKYYITSGGKIPVIQTAPEVSDHVYIIVKAINNSLENQPIQTLQYKKYSIYSDVQGFGYVLYEMWSLGK